MNPNKFSFHKTHFKVMKMELMIKRNEKSRVQFRRLSLSLREMERILRTKKIMNNLMKSLLTKFQSSKQENLVPNKHLHQNLKIQKPSKVKNY